VVPGSFVQFCIDQIFPERCIVCGAVIETARAAAPVHSNDAAPVPSLNLPSHWPEAALEFFRVDLSMRLLPGVRVSARTLCAPCWLTLEPAGSVPSPAMRMERAAGVALRLQRTGAAEPRWAGAALCERAGEIYHIITPFVTNDTLLTVIKYLKFSSGRRAVPPLAWWMAYAFRRWVAPVRDPGEPDPVVTAVPLHPARRRRRGYNQSTLLAAAVAGMLDLPFDDSLLARTRNTRPQSKLPAERRAENVRGAFALRGGARIMGRALVLVDDLVTTGETIGACVQALRDANPASIIILAAGRVRHTAIATSNPGAGNGLRE
jgi:ComF family protein